MEHLPLPKNPMHGPEEVPYVCNGTYLYDCEGFLEFPDRKNLAVDGVFSRESINLPVDNVSAFIQAWLWFGLGHEFLGNSFSFKNFIRTNENGQNILTTARLIAMTNAWVQGQRRLSMKESLARLTHWKMCLFRVDEVMMAIEGDYGDDKIDHRISRAVLALAEFFAQAVKKAYPLGRSVTDGLHFDCHRARGRKHYEALLAGPHSRWCKSEPPKLALQANSIATLHYLTNLAPPGWSDDPNFEKDHTRCTTEHCAAYQINPYTYETRHTTIGCNCSKLVAETKQVATILRDKDTIPILRVSTEDSQGTVRLDIVERKPSSRYVAISHVWADGMGDPKANALPSCQLKLLKDRINKLPPRNSVASGIELSDDNSDSRLRAARRGKAKLERRTVTINSREDAVRELRASFADMLDATISNEPFQREFWGKFVDLYLRGDFDRMRKMYPPLDGLSGISRVVRLAVASPDMLELLSPFIPIFLEGSGLGGPTSKIGEDLDRIIGQLDALAHGYKDNTANTNTEAENAQGKHDEVFLWIDTICCPVSGAEKVLSVEKLKTTYEEADYVLVIDTYLETIDSSQHSDLELLMRIFVSAWTRRLWTLQEGVMAKELVFQFADRAVKLQPLFQSFRQEHDVSESAMVQDVEEMVEQLVVFGGKQGALVRSSPDKLWNALQCRSVSFASDEPLCIKNLLDLDYGLPKGQSPTMEDVWNAMPDIPATIVFKSGQRLSKEGYRWAPSSFLGRKARSYTSGNLDMPWEFLGAELKSRGLEVEFPGFLMYEGLPDLLEIASNNPSNDSSMYPGIKFLVDDSNQCYRLVWEKSGFSFQDNSTIPSNGNDTINSNEKSSTHSCESGPVHFGESDSIYSHDSCSITSNELDNLDMMDSRWAIIVPKFPEPDEGHNVPVQTHFIMTPALYAEIYHVKKPPATLRYFVRSRRLLRMRPLFGADILIPTAKECVMMIDPEIVAAVQGTQALSEYHLDWLKNLARNALEVAKELPVENGKGLFGQVGDSPDESDVDDFRMLILELLWRAVTGVDLEMLRTDERQKWVVD